MKTRRRHETRCKKDAEPWRIEQGCMSLSLPDEGIRGYAKQAKSTVIPWSDCIPFLFIS